MAEQIIEEWVYFNAIVMRRATTRSSPHAGHRPAEPTPNIATLADSLLASEAGMSGTGVVPPPQQAVLPSAAPAAGRIPPIVPGTPAGRRGLNLGRFLLVLLGLMIVTILVILYENPKWRDVYYPASRHAPNPVPAATGAIVTNFTQFHTVRFHRGEVTTGWVFQRNGDTHPTMQYCYYLAPAALGRMLSASPATPGQPDQVSVKYNIEDRPGGRSPLPQELGSAGWNQEEWGEAAGNCVWFGASSYPTPEGSASPKPPASKTLSHAPQAPQPVTFPPVPVPEAAPAPLSEAAFNQGLSDRREWEQFFSNLPEGDEKAGAAWWAANRSQKSDCAKAGLVSQSFLDGCSGARARLTSFDERRRMDPAYRRGWNSYQNADDSHCPQTLGNIGTQSVYTNVEQWIACVKQ